MAAAKQEINIGFVVAEFNRDLTWQMELLGKEHASFLGAKVTKVFYVPGVYDMPLAVKKMAEDKSIDAIVTIGSVIEGSTDHDQVVVAQATRKITDLSLEYNKPIALGIAGPGMTRLEAHDRIDYSKRAVEAVVKMVRRIREY
ncbi:6,7-dimethyl-8-ribityllumazine synthase [Methanocella sp. CWC-04]|uniref:6,7-dimethyl-8-ribityllumazine synthase n=1 Tax=Methanooceanicella nereidis TaxID=2052831 RepID=A0AAP2RD80_9EURY|nr:6,7-dimethyl-8-ribityllumazine synthase [Methanocella sp. CWC-04]MCD1295178.1 6,7-dimethyl-8-ribityllumazine synthase [Methanocella sp. CWC-04]